MKLVDCKNCRYHVNSIADSALCRFGNETECKVVFRGEVLSCPIETSLMK